MLTGAVAAIAAADALIVGGTSLVVYPAAGLTRYFTGDTLAICNLAPTDQDANADLLISCNIAAAIVHLSNHGLYPACAARFPDGLSPYATVR